MLVIATPVAGLTKPGGLGSPLDSHSPFQKLVSAHPVALSQQKCTCFWKGGRQSERGSCPVAEHAC
jgi:hypothetical protein